MPQNVLVADLEYTKILLAVLIMGYAYYLLRRSEGEVERRPWEYLYIAAMLLFLIQLITTLQTFRGAAWTEEFFTSLQKLLELAFFGTLLLSFAFQDGLLQRQKLLLIHHTSGVTTPYERLLKKISAYKKRKRERFLDGELERMKGAGEESEEDAPAMRGAGEESSEDPSAPTGEEPSRVATSVAEKGEGGALASEKESAVRQGEEGKEEEGRALVERTRRLIRATEELLARHEGEIESERACEVRSSVDELKRLLTHDPPPLGAIKRQVELLTGREGQGGSNPE